MTLNRAELFLKKNLDAAVDAIKAAGGDPVLLVHDSEEWETYDSTHKAAAFAREVAAPVTYRVRNRVKADGIPGFTFAVIYDGPYDADNAEEIIYDCNESASQLMDKVAGRS